MVLLFSSIEILTKELQLEDDNKIIFRLKKLSKYLNKKNIINEVSFKKYRKQFEKKVIEPRNALEHSHKEISIKVMQEAYIASFHIIWYLNQINSDELELYKNGLKNNSLRKLVKSLLMKLYNAI